MLSRLRAATSLLRPRALAHTAKSVEDLAATVEQMRRSMKESTTESSRLAERAQKLEADVKSLQQSLQDVALREAQLAAIYKRDRELADAVGELASVLDIQAIAAHVRSAMLAAPLHLDPFPHMVVDQVWPEPFYKALLTGLPPYELFADRPRNKQRLVVPFDWAPIYSSRVWDFLIEDVLDPIVTPIVVEKFRKPLGDWLLENWPLPVEDPVSQVHFHSTDGRILLRGRGYLIPPHRDPKWGLVTCLLYLARPGDSENWGTQLYSVESDVEAPSVAAYWIKADRCQLQKDVPFRRNSMLLFLNSHGAHGAHIPPDAEPAQLQRYMYQFRVGPNQASIRELMRMLPPERQSFWAGKVTDYN